MELAYCGLNCGECPIYLASISGNTQEQTRLANEYSTDACKFLKDDMFCLGCRSGATSEKMCGGCEMRTLGLKKRRDLNCSKQSDAASRNAE